ncbi:hypothetical protein SAY87_026279 [Trapa incisa]|uniref:Uncharacterized protein n=1 Tax=Trapa incisa TaxID=236973 RepID=A0AAN7GV53_9MYRT|nr:hypothetical protein SAY87_026279 [Trapa incisa]
MDFGPGTRETAQNYTAYIAGMSCELRWCDEDLAALVRPPRKSTSPLARSRASHRHRGTILQGQKELMEMVKEMPETYYELSLADLVEKPAPEGQVEGWWRDGECPSDKKANLERRESRKMVQNGSQSHLDGKARQMAMMKR